MLKKCTNCSIVLKGRQTKYCSDDCKNKIKQNYVAQCDRGTVRKKHFVEKKGGQCEICGYKKNYAALCFHHLDSSEKSFGVDLRALSNNSMEKLEIEVDKCQLLCHNCHMELHHSGCDL